MAEVLQTSAPSPYRARVLPPEEFDRLQGLPLYATVAGGQALVVVVEHGGMIIATWAVLDVFHLEGAWIAPSYRKTSVAGRLAHEMFDALRTAGIPQVLTITQADDTAQLAQHLGGQPILGQLWLIPVPPESA